MRIIKILFPCVLAATGLIIAQEDAIALQTKPLQNQQQTFTGDQKQIINEFYQALESGDTLKLTTLLTDDYQVINLSSINESSYSKFSIMSKNLKIRSVAYKKAFPEGSFKISQIVSEKDKMICYVTFTGIQKGTFLGVASTERPLTIKYVHIFNLKNGKIAEFSEMWNELAVMKQMGQIVL